MRFLPLAVLLLAACGSEEETDEPIPDTDRPDTGCPELFVWVDGPQPPRVGDTWTVLLKCRERDNRESTITGPMVLRADPASAASIDIPEVTFLEPGPLSLRVQVGSFRVTEDITVIE